MPTRKYFAALVGTIVVLLTASVAAQSVVTLAWDPVSAAASYTLKVDGQVCAQVPSPTTQADCLTPETGRPHVYTVTATNVAGVSSVSSEPVVTLATCDQSQPIGVVIGRFDREGAIGQPVKAWVNTLTPMVQLRVQLQAPGASVPTDEGVVDAPAGMQIEQAIAQVVPSTAGVWHLYAKVFDAQGCSAPTRLVRTVTIQ
jgi:hypothetical protein